MALYIGTAQGFYPGVVVVDGHPLPPCNDIMNHSPDGFAWGYEGSGPAQLALAIMVNEYGCDLEKHPIHYQELKRGIVAKFHPTGFSCTSEQIRDWINHAKS